MATRQITGTRYSIATGSGTSDYLVTGEMTAVRENGATSGVGVLATFAYDDQGRRSKLTRGNGGVTNYSYDPASRLASQMLDLSGTANDLTLGFSYNPAGQIASASRSNDAYAWQGHYNIDRPYTVNGLNQLTAAGGTALGYDARGNLTGSGSDSFTYSSENMLTSGPGAVTLAYDPLLRRREQPGGRKAGRGPSRGAGRARPRISLGGGTGPSIDRRRGVGRACP